MESDALSLRLAPNYSRLYWVSLTVISVLILYGSLFPFEFVYPMAPGVWAMFAASWTTTSSVGDSLGNILLFVPFGALGVLVLLGKHRLSSMVLWLSVSGGLLALVCQLIQLYIPSRVPAIGDVYWNLAGIWLGVAAGFYAHKRHWLPSEVSRVAVNVPLILIGLWFAAILMPFVPTIDWQAYKSSVKPLLLQPDFHWAQCLLLSLQWLIVIGLVERYRGRKWRMAELCGVIVAIVALKIVIVTNTVSVSDVVALMAGVLIWRYYPSVLHFKQRLAWLLLFAVFMDGISPFVWQSPAASFLWLPLAGLLTGSMVGNVGALLEKLFVFSAFFWLLRDLPSNRYWGAAAMALAAVVVGEIIQRSIAGHTAELTDIIVLLSCAYAIRWFWLAGAADNTGEASSDNSATAPAPTNTLRAFTPWVRQAAILCVGISIGLYVVTNLPGMPYNVRELFRFDATGVDLLFMSLALLWVGFGSTWMGRCLAHSARPALMLPLLGVGLSVVLYALLWVSVTEESIRDIAGSSVFVHRLGSRGVMGQWGIDFVASVGADNLRLLIEPIEPIVRLGALVGPFLMLLGILHAAVLHPGNGSVKGVRSRPQFFVTLGRYLLFALPWFYVCKVIAFDWSSTDNLNELIARDNALGMGGGFYLYLLCCLLAAGGVVLTWVFLRRKESFVGLALLGVVVSIAPGWLLLNAGLTDNVGKYGFDYSGVDFLLGPDRATLLSGYELFGRWVFLQLGAMVGIATGSCLHMRSVSSQQRAKADEALSALVGLQLQRSQPPVLVNVRLYQAQIDFLDELAQTMGKTRAAVVSSILDQVEPSYPDPIARELKYASELSLDDNGEPETLKRYPLALSKGQRLFITRVSIDLKLSQSRVVRRAVAWFIRDCQS